MFNFRGLFHGFFCVLECVLVVFSHFHSLSLFKRVGVQDAFVRIIYLSEEVPPKMTFRFGGRMRSMMASVLLYWFSSGGG